MSIASYLLLSTIVFNNNTYARSTTVDTIVVRDLSKEDCEALKREREAVVKNIRARNFGSSGDTSGIAVGFSKHSCTKMEGTK